MSVLFSSGNSSLISHESFINRIYDGVISNDGERSSYKINANLFELNVPYRYKTPDETQTKKRQRKIINKTRNAVAEEHREEYELVLFSSSQFKISILSNVTFYLQIERIKLNLAKFIAECRQQNVLSFEEDEARNLTNETLKQFLDQWQSVECSYGANFNGGNESKNPVIIELNGTSHLIPPKCTFSNADIQTIERIGAADGYDFIIMDPPWWNKYVRRSRKFNSENGLVSDFKIEFLILI